LRLYNILISNNETKNAYRRLFENLYATYGKTNLEKVKKIHKLKEKVMKIQYFAEPQSAQLQ